MHRRGLGHWESPSGVRSPNGESLATWKPPFSPCTMRYAQGCTSALAVCEKTQPRLATILALTHVRLPAHAVGLPSDCIRPCVRVTVDIQIECFPHRSGSRSSRSLANLPTSVASLNPFSSCFADSTSMPNRWQILCCIWSIAVSSCSASMPTWRSR